MDKSIHFYRREIDRKCRDFHGVLANYWVEFYINTFCSHLPKDLQYSLRFHQHYSRRHNRTKMEGDEGDYEMWLENRWKFTNTDDLQPSA